MVSGRGQSHRRKRVKLRLYIANHTATCLQAIANLRALRERGPLSACEVEVIDLRKEPKRARKDQIVAVPTLVRYYPKPEKRVIGNLSAANHVLLGLE